MPCYHPIQGFKAKSKDPQKTLLVFKRSQSWRGESLKIPCGQCIGCRLEKSRQWAVRCVHEASLYAKNCFITLTYSDENLPPKSSLCLKHFQDFMKRLRKRFGPGIRFFHCGEYGERLERPHYHALLFNHDFEDRKLWTEREEQRLYVSRSLSELWPLGFSTVGDVTFNSASYVARYVVKKITGKGAEQHYLGRTPEYITMSRRPGIGRRWFETFRGDVYPADDLIVRGNHSRPPRYYDDLLGKTDPSLLASLKIEREKNRTFDSFTLCDKEMVKKSEIDLFQKRTLEE